MCVFPIFLVAVVLGSHFFYVVIAYLELVCFLENFLQEANADAFAHKNDVVHQIPHCLELVFLTVGKIHSQELLGVFKSFVARQTSIFVAE